MDDQGERSPLTGAGIVVEGLSLYGPGGRSFDRVSFTATAGDLILVCGGARVARSALLLALTGRLGPLDGIARVGGYQLPEQAREVRKLSSVARIKDMIEPDRSDSVGDLLATASIDSTLAPYLADLDGAAVFSELPPAQRVLLLTSLALACEPRLVAVDDVDADCDDEQAAIVWQALAAVAATGRTVLASADWAEPAATVVVELRRPQAVDPRDDPTLDLSQQPPPTSAPGPERLDQP